MQSKEAINSQEVKQLLKDNSIGQKNNTAGLKGTPVSRMGDAVLEEIKKQSKLVTLGEPKAGTLWKIVNGDILNQASEMYQEHLSIIYNLGLIRGTVTTDCNESYKMSMFYNKDTYDVNYYEVEYKGELIVTEMR